MGLALAEEYCPRCDRTAVPILEAVARLGFVTVCSQCGTETEQATGGARYSALLDWTACGASGGAGIDWDGDCDPKTAFELARHIGETHSVLPWERCQAQECGSVGRWAEAGARLCRDHRARYLYHLAQLNAQRLPVPRSSDTVVELAQRAIKDAPLAQGSLFLEAA